ncbi:hypothetical protein BaRGS_00031352 [Batillaria attramentaria]|uniref:Uncharacterized protein n=1 Tax=Batillaria attramentaria TaxID=370345 RepID=A0ABD0JRJ3_9CAEN
MLQSSTLLSHALKFLSFPEIPDVSHHELSKSIYSGYRQQPVKPLSLWGDQTWPWCLDQNLTIFPSTHLRHRQQEMFCSVQFEVRNGTRDRTVTFCKQEMHE